jgi:hypothetical protein
MFEVQLKRQRFGEGSMRGKKRRTGRERRKTTDRKSRDPWQVEKETNRNNT